MQNGDLIFMARLGQIPEAPAPDIAEVRNPEQQKTMADQQIEKAEEMIEQPPMATQ